MSVPLVSVLITSYNREKYIAEAIESVLAQTFDDYEIIVVDDASTDGTIDVIKTYAAKDARIRYYVNEKNLGDYPNRNKVASYAVGKYLKYIDSDDVMYDHCLHVMVSSMERFPEAGFGLCTIQDPHKPFPMAIPGKQAYEEHFSGLGHFHRAPGSAIIKREVFEKEGGFSGRPLIGDNELWFKLANRYPVVKFVSGLYWDRNHGDQERFSNYAKKHYRKLRYDTTVAALNNKECPLGGGEKSRALKRIKREFQKHQLKSALLDFKEIFIKRKNPYDRL
ncbi:glycosyltransferase family 2 protein [Flavisolibacter ginsenosidimutans]|uniref:Glycosyltransferase family 2 protein n=1 Tax=Flavisolibacter ginsenosidimutans TaxID=661481 RepID=A0A5B8UET4_9BACT|nr:glycosyltransferase family 2 protein [Flavisolibacter ginsenosidimutans]QEC54875.1 glycosyltransferase family 2 protein [Flavisolibacter ginsenosidimutans]